jgi:PAS domain S-box-containing protein
MKILAVEDDQDIGQALEFLFKTYNYAVDLVTDGEAGLQMAEAYDYDLILLDIMLPKLDGISLCQQLRQKGCQSPILLLTGQSEHHQKAIALNAGADDYVVKPFDAEELMARVQALLRRGGPTSLPILSWGSLSIDPSRRKVTYATHLLSLTPKEYAILELLLRNPKSAMSNNAILDHVWRSLESVGEAAVRFQIKELRRKLTAVGAPKDLIQTKARVGYQLNPLYASAPTPQATDPLSAPQIAELNSVNDELRTTLEALRTTQAELRHREQQLQTANQALEQQVADQTIELTQAEEQFRLLATHAPVGIFQTDPAGDCIFVNLRWLEFAGLSLAQAMGQGWANALHPEDRARVFQEWNEAVESGREFHSEYRFQTRTGQVRWVMGGAVSMQDEAGVVTGYLGTVTDISERKQAELKIREQAVLLDIASDAIAVRDLQNRIIYWNRGAERLYGWAATEAIGQCANQLLYKPPCNSSHAVTDVITHGEWQGELQQITKTGQEVFVISRWTLVRDEHDQPKFILVVNTDITEKKQLEAQFLRAQRLESIGTLSSGIAHDLNNMLTPILVGIQLLRLKFPDEHPQELLQMMENNARRGADLVQQVLTFARGTEGKRIPLQLNHLLAEIQQVCQHTFPKNITVTLDVPANLAIVSADPTQLQQVLMNLCVNARDAMPQGGELHLSAENFVVDETYNLMNRSIQVGSYLVITVADTGTGMAPEELEHIFDPFFTTKPVGEGTGLGLSVAQGIIRNHGGFIAAESKLGEGTQFKLYLPNTTTVVSQPTLSTTLQLGQGELILVIEDEADLCEIVKTVLETSNYQVITASNGIEGVARYAKHRDDIGVVLLDMMMPEMDGYTALQTLKRLNPQVQIIVSSGLPLNLAAVGTADLVSLPKPYTAQDLLVTVHQVLSAADPAIHREDQD